MRTVLISLVAGAVVAGQSGGASAAAELRVVAAENVYGDIAGQIGGAHVVVTSILTDPNADPHLYEPGTANGLAVAKAAVVIENGLGYDTFVDRLEAASPKRGRIQLTIAHVLGLSGARTNPHVWYDVPALPRIATAIESALAQADPRNAAAYRVGLARFLRSLAPLQAVVAAIKARHAGEAVAYTEPVPGYLLTAAGLRNLAPDSFTRPIEEGTEPPPSAVAEMLGLMKAHRVRVLLYNRQAVSPITARVRAAALAAGIPVVAVTETLPPGLTFQSWQIAQARALLAATGG
jgi:zinc/manganese transport system substrate-binding protein